MDLKSTRELEVTRKKLRALEERYEAIRNEAVTNKYARQLTLRSLKSMINQLTEEIVRFEGRATGSRPDRTPV